MKIKFLSAALFACLSIGSVNAQELGSNLSDRLSYIATWPDLIMAFGTDDTRAPAHFESYGHVERRMAETQFDANEYMAENPDIAAYCGLTTTNAEDETVKVCAIKHFITTGFNEGRSWSDLVALSYLASHSDLMRVYGANPDGGRRHWINNGKREGRRISFNITSYLMARPTSFKQYRTDQGEALHVYITNGSLPY